MNPDLHSYLFNFLKTFFLTNDCKIINMSDNSISVQLTRELDLFMMNRPFYWHYMDKMNKQGETLSLTLTTNPNNQQTGVEFIHFGSPRYQQISTHLQRNEILVKLYESVYTTRNTPLFPWLLTNIKIIYKGHQIREELFSIGLNLINGQMKTNMMEHIKSYPLEKSIPDYCHCISPLITLANGYRRIEDVILNYIKEQDFTWSEKSLQAMTEELAMLNYFFINDKDDEQYDIEKTKIYKRFSPSITIDVISAGMIYLTEGFHKKVE